MTMNIDRNNYLFFALDYVDGKMDPLLKEAFETFLESHPDIREELSSAAGLRLRRKEIRYPDKEGLKKSSARLSDHVPPIDIECISFLENDMEPGQRKTFMARLGNDARMAQLMKVYARMRLEPDTNKFEQKDLLKKPVERVPLYWWISYAAAAVLLGLLLFQVVTNRLTAPGPAHISEPVISERLEVPEPIQGTSSPLPPGPSTGSTTMTAPDGSPATGTPVAGTPVAGTPVAGTLIQRDPGPVKEPASEQPGTFSGPSPMIQMSALGYREGGVIPTARGENHLHPPTIYLTEYLSERDLRALASYGVEDFKVKLIKDPRPDGASPPLILSLVQTGINGINKITGWEMQLSPTLNEKGQVRSFSFRSEELKISSQVHND